VATHALKIFPYINQFAHRDREKLMSGLDLNPSNKNVLLQIFSFAHATRTGAARTGRGFSRLILSDYDHFASAIAQPDTKDAYAPHSSDVAYNR
jgi:hypothetical protein